MTSLKCPTCVIKLGRPRCIYKSIPNNLYLFHDFCYFVCCFNGVSNFPDLTNLSLSNDIIPDSSSARNRDFISLTRTCLSLIRLTLLSKILSFPHPRHPSKSSSFSSFCSHSTCKFTCLQQTWLLQFTLLWHLTSKSQQTSTHSNQNSLARVITNTSKYQHITLTLKRLHWLPIKQRIEYKFCLLTYKTLTNQQPTYLYNSLSFPSHCLYKIFWFTRSFHSICQIITWQKGFHWSTTLEFTSSGYPKFEFSTSFPFQAQNTPL